MTLRHPGLVTVHAMGVWRGTSHVVMERICGTTLEAHLAERGRLGVAETVRTLRSVAETLAVVHDTGIAHRDVKPGNVMLCTGGRIVVMDFGTRRHVSTCR